MAPWGSLALWDGLDLPRKEKIASKTRSEDDMYGRRGCLESLQHTQNHISTRLTMLSNWSSTDGTRSDWEGDGFGQTPWTLIYVS